MSSEPDADAGAQPDPSPQSEPTERPETGEATPGAAAPAADAASDGATTDRATDDPTRPETRASLGSKLAIAFSDIKIAHSVFALPFAVLAAFLVGPGRALSERTDAAAETDGVATDGAAADGAAELAAAAADEGSSFTWWSFVLKLGLIVLCMVFARTWAMLVNRLADRKLDAENPRTAKRAFAAGTLSTLDGLLMLAGSAALFIGACALFLLFDNRWPLYGSVPVLLWIAFYSFTKRFTRLCHLFLGGALAVSPVAAGVAVDPAALAMPSLWFLAAMVLCWVAGFDVIYALQDHEHDSDAGLHSIPAKLGPKRAINVSRVLHLACFLALLMAWGLNPHLASVFGVGVGATGALLITEHLVLAKRGEAGLNMAFFTLNGVISVALGLTGVVDVFV